MQITTKETYIRLMEDNPGATVGTELATMAIIAATQGYCETRNTVKGIAIYRELKQKFGSYLKSPDVLKEMVKAAKLARTSKEEKN